MPITPTSPVGTPVIDRVGLTEVSPMIWSGKGWEVIGPIARMFMPPETSDAVNHPKHYTSHPSGVECIEITEHMNFNVGNAFKYLWRAGLKSDNPIQDLSKAVWYAQREIKRLEYLATK